MIGSWVERCLWTTPAQLAAFDENNDPFAGLAVPKDMRIRHSAGPAVHRAVKTNLGAANRRHALGHFSEIWRWLARLRSCVPNPTWSNLPLSGLFVGGCCKTSCG